jgi:hypothetical protein
MRNFIAKLAIVGGVGAAALALPATSAFAGTTTQDPHPCPTVTQTFTPLHQGGTQDNNKCDNNGHQGDGNGRGGDNGNQGGDKGRHGHEGDNHGNQGDHHGNRDCKPELRFFSDTQVRDNGNWNDGNQGRGNDWGRGGNEWQLPCVTHQQPRCVRCYVQNVFFNVRQGSSHFTEVSGPTLVNGELLKYNHVIYSVRNVWGHSFQLNQGPVGPVHAGATHVWAKATTVCQQLIHRPVLWNVRH